MARYRLTPAAERDLQDILDYTAHQWGLEQALRYKEKLETACNVLAASPAAGIDSRKSVPAIVATVSGGTSFTSCAPTTEWQ